MAKDNKGTGGGKTGDISFPNQEIVNVTLEHEMEKSFIDYAMSVIVNRALPDVRDGLKPVHRRILYAMYEDNLTSDRQFRKSATTVGNVLGRFHPHGDASVYDALVRLAQDFSLRYPLVDGHGNFGSVDGDPPAAYRYTEARMSKISNQMLRDIEKRTVDFNLNYDDTRQEPVVLPSRFPNLLVNGSSGIAVGMTTNIPPHNLTEVINATICLIENPEAGLEDLMEHIKGPDFPTRGIIMGKSGIRSAYATGKGRVKVRARTEMEEYGQGRTRIIVTELPYQVNKARLIESIAEHVKDKRLEGISGLRDESDRDGMRIVIELKRDANPQVVLNRLYAATQLQITFAVVLLALVNNQSQPKQLSLREILDEYIVFQKEVLVRRTEYDLKKAEDRAHLLEGLRVAVDNIDEVIRVIRSSYSEARERLMERFELSEVQAQAILEMQLRRVQGLEREKIENEYNELQEKIAYYNKLLSDPMLLQGVLIEELTEIRDKYGDERFTEIEAVDNDIDVEDLIEEEDCVYTITNAGYIKRMAADIYRAQKRGGKGITALTTREEDYVETVFNASTHDYILFFTNYGRVYKKKGYLIPESGRTAKGTNIINIIAIESGEKVSAMMHIREFADDVYIVMTTKMGTVKRMRMSELKNIRNVGIRALNLAEGDELISVSRTRGDENMIIATHKGRAICFSETDIRPMGRTAAGVRGIKLKGDDYCVSAVRGDPEATLLTITENGYGKRTNIEEYLRGGGEGGGVSADEDESAADTDADLEAAEGGETGAGEGADMKSERTPQNRGGTGLKNYNITEKTGNIAAVMAVEENDDILIISNDGTIIRMAASDISIFRRTTMGVRLMRLDGEAKVISASKTERIEEEIEEEVANQEDNE